MEVPLRSAKMESSTLASTICLGWDSRAIANTTRGDAMACKEPHLSISGNITPEGLAATLGTVEQANGFGNRFPDRGVPPSADAAEGGRFDPSPVADALRANFDRLPFGETEVRFSPDADELRVRSYPELRRGRPGVTGKMLGRLAPQALRLSMIYALCDGRTVIEPCDYMAALAVTKYAEDSVMMVFGVGRDRRGATDWPARSWRGSRRTSAWPAPSCGPRPATG